mmetsp:Transcript_92905/g.184426  ORF Transcript_92905/g.184426 Transcript_92905/m.184426 type:complete len:83 (-) Transcript_92905:34-282(-)
MTCSIHFYEHYRSEWPRLEVAPRAMYVAVGLPHAVEPCLAIPRQSIQRGPLAQAPFRALCPAGTSHAAAATTGASAGCKGWL